MSRKKKPEYPWGNYFTNRVSGVTVRIDNVSEFWTTLSVQTQLMSTFKYPISDYDSVFVKTYRPLDTGRMRVPDTFRPPKNWQEWLKEEDGAKALAREVAAAEEEMEDGPVRIDDGTETTERAAARLKANMPEGVTAEDMEARVRASLKG